jgi:hypothetical protein
MTGHRTRLLKDNTNGRKPWEFRGLLEGKCNKVFDLIPQETARIRSSWGPWRLTSELIAVHNSIVKYILQNTNSSETFVPYIKLIFYKLFKQPEQ